MFKAFGTVIVLYALSSFFTTAFASFENALVAVFATVETAADVSTEQIERIANTE